MPTQEQKDRAAARRQQFKKLAGQLAKMTDAERDAVAGKLPALVNCDGHVLSVTNTALIYLQGGTNCTMVGGFRKWIKQGRAVKKGEHGFMIWVPSKKNGNEDKPENYQTPGTSEPSDSNLFFLTGTVFDVAQTQEIETTGA